MIRHIAPLLLTLLVAPAATHAQNVLYESLTGADWRHVHGAPYWQDDVPDSSSYFGKVDRLVGAGLTWLQFVRPGVALTPGTYVASARVKKLTSTAGRADLLLEARMPGAFVSSKTAATRQVVGQWVLLAPVRFTVRKPGQAVTFSLHNKSGLKRDYLFDSFVLDRVGGPAVVAFQNLVTWRVSSPGGYVTIPSDVSHFGTVRRRVPGQRVNLPSSRQTLPAGSYRATARLRPPAGPVAKSITLRVWSGRSLLAAATLRASAQRPGRWTDTPELLFTLPAGGATVDFRFFDPKKTVLPAYEFATFALLRNDSYDTYGAGCRGSNGVPTLTPVQNPKVGRSFSIRLDNLRPAAPAVVLLGMSDRFMGAIPLPFDLAPLGAAGCRVLADPTLQFALTTGNGTATWGYPIPADRSFTGTAFYNQAAVRDRGANALGLALSNGGRGIIGR